MKQILTKYIQVNKNDTAQERKVVPLCFLCTKVPEQGMRGGFFFRGIFICRACEESLIQAESHDKETYLLALANLKRILFPQ